MPKYLSNAEINRLAEYLTMYASLPFGHDVPGEIVEELVARSRGATYVGKRANRPEPDMVLNGLNYQIKTEKCPDNRISALSRRDKIEDIITARVDVLSDYGKLPNDPEALGRLVLCSYNENVVRKYRWDRLAILLRYKQNNEFLYFEEDALIYDENAFHWTLTSAGRRESKLNIIGYDWEGQKKFKWNVGTTLLYVFHRIPEDADYFEIRKKCIEFEDFRAFMASQDYPSDEKIRDWILDTLETNERILSIFRPEVTVHEACVTLSGDIYPKVARDTAIKAAWSVPGVRDVYNRMRLLHESQAAPLLARNSLQAEP